MFLHDRLYPSFCVSLLAPSHLASEFDFSFSLNIHSLLQQESLFLPRAKTFGKENLDWGGCENYVLFGVNLF